MTQAEAIELLERLRGEKAPDGIRVLVSTEPYSGRTEPEWCELDHVSPGTASVYPVKYRVPGAGIGQAKFGEVLALREGAV